MRQAFQREIQDRMDVVLTLFEVVYASYTSELLTYHNIRQYSQQTCRSSSQAPSSYLYWKNSSSSCPSRLGGISGSTSRLARGVLQR